MRRTVLIRQYADTAEFREVEDASTADSTLYGDNLDILRRYQRRGDLRDASWG